MKRRGAAEPIRGLAHRGYLEYSGIYIGSFIALSIFLAATLVADEMRNTTGARIRGPDSGRVTRSKKFTIINP